MKHFQILGVFIAKKNYRIQKYAFVFLIVVGVILFIYKEGKTKPEEENSILGLIAIGVSLLSDGILGGIEDRIQTKSKPSALSIMTKINFFSSILLLVLVVVTREFLTFFEFAQRNPEIWGKIAASAFAGSFGQIFIFLIIAEFGALACSIATTTRKFFSVLFSAIFLGNALTNRQWIATGIVFSALFADALFGKRDLRTCEKDKKPTRVEEKDVENGENGVEMEKLNK
jgi:UDP-galactose transporter B1